MGSLSEELEEIKAEICDQLCKHREKIEDEEELYKICENCPLGRL